MKHDTNPVTVSPGALPPLGDARERQINADYEWCLRDAAVRRQHGGRVVVAYRGRVLGAGRTHAEAWQTASRDAACPGKDHVAFVAVPEPSV